MVSVISTGSHLTWYRKDICIHLFMNRDVGGHTVQEWIGLEELYALPPHPTCILYLLED